jgi:hypothetical protein
MRSKWLLEGWRSRERLIIARSFEKEQDGYISNTIFQKREKQRKKFRSMSRKFCLLNKPAASLIR